MSGVFSSCLLALGACSGASTLPSAAGAPLALAGIGTFATGTVATGTITTESPRRGITPGRETAPLDSHVTGITVAGSQNVGTFNGVPYTRTYGIVSGTVDEIEPIVGKSTLPTNKNGDYPYAVEYEIIAPAAGSQADRTILLDAENRGSSVFLSATQGISGGAPSATTYPAGLGNGFLQKHGIAYARVQWQTGVAASVPAGAQGLGLAIVRDFGRMLAGQTPAVKAAGGFTPGTYPKRTIAGISQSAWFVNTLIAEGFNVDPVRGVGVYNAAIAVDGAGNWMAINKLGAAMGAAPVPYPLENATPLAPTALLTRPASDPVYIDIANYTDFYRLRASVSDANFPNSATYRRYDMPTPHAAGGIGQFAGGTCGADVPTVQLNPISYASYVRALTVDTIATLTGAPGKLPPTSSFSLVAPAAGLTDLNLLPGVAVTVPAVDADGMPVGGVRIPDADLPLGNPSPVSLGPVTIAIDQTCGNIGGWVPFTAAAVATRYGTKAAYLAAYTAKAKALETADFLLPEDEATVLGAAGAIFDYDASH
jgi:hypothetical protein